MILGSRVNAASASTPAPPAPPIIMESVTRTKPGKSVSDERRDSMMPQVISIAAKPASPAQPRGRNSRVIITANPIQKTRLRAAFRIQNGRPNPPSHASHEVRMRRDR